MAWDDAPRAGFLDSAISGGGLETSDWAPRPDLRGSTALGALPPLNAPSPSMPELALPAAPAQPLSVRDYLSQRYAPPTPDMPAPAPAQGAETPGFWNELGATTLHSLVESNSEMLAGTLRTLGHEGDFPKMLELADALDDWRASVDVGRPPRVGDFRELGIKHREYPQAGGGTRRFLDLTEVDLDAAIDYTAGAIGQIVGSIAPVLGLGAIGAAGGPVLAAGGALVGSTALVTGEAFNHIKDELEHMGVDKREAEQRAARGAIRLAPILGALDALPIMQFGRAVTKPAMEAVKGRIMRDTVQALGSGTGKGFIAEGLTEGTQNALMEAYAAAETGNSDDFERAMRTVNALLIGGIGGGAFRGVGEAGATAYKGLRRGAEPGAPPETVPAPAAQPEMGTAEQIDPQPGERDPNAEPGTPGGELLEEERTTPRTDDILMAARDNEAAMLAGVPAGLVPGKTVRLDLADGAKDYEIVRTHVANYNEDEIGGPVADVTFDVRDVQTGEVYEKQPAERFANAQVIDVEGEREEAQAAAEQAEQERQRAEEQARKDQEKAAQKAEQERQKATEAAEKEYEAQNRRMALERDRLGGDEGTYAQYLDEQAAKLDRTQTPEQQRFHVDWTMAQVEKAETERVERERLQAEETKRIEREETERQKAAEKAEQERQKEAEAAEKERQAQAEQARKDREAKAKREEDNRLAAERVVTAQDELEALVGRDDAQSIIEESMGERDPVEGLPFLQERLKRERARVQREERERREQERLAAQEAPLVEPQEEEAARAEEAPATPPGTSTPEEVRAEVETVNVEPTQGQMEAGNYKKGHVKVAGLDISIENPAGSVRGDKETGGQRWQVTMPAHYGYILRTEGADGDKLDAYVNPEAADYDTVYVVDQADADSGVYDEHKAMLGYTSVREVRQAYDAAFDDGRGPERRRAVVRMPMEEFQSWLKEGDTKAPISEQVQASDTVSVFTKPSLPFTKPKAPRVEAVKEPSARVKAAIGRLSREKTLERLRRKMAQTEAPAADVARSEIAASMKMLGESADAYPDFVRQQAQSLAAQVEQAPTPTAETPAPAPEAPVPDEAPRTTVEQEVAAAEMDEGVPMAQYVPPTKNRPIERFDRTGGRRAGFDGGAAFALGAIKGQQWHTNGHMIMKGAPPRGAKVSDRTDLNFQKQIPKGKEVDTVPVGFATMERSRGTKTAKMSRPAIHFSRGGAVDSALYDYVLRRQGADVTWKSAGGNPDSPLTVYKGDELVAVVMPTRQEAPPAIKAMKREAAKAKARTKKKAAAKRHEAAPEEAIEVTPPTQETPLPEPPAAEASGNRIFTDEARERRRREREERRRKRREEGAEGFVAGEGGKVDLSDLEDLGFEIGYQVEKGVRKAVDVARAVKAELAEEWNALKVHFADEYEKVREVFEDEPWAGEMTPEDAVQSELDTLEGAEATETTPESAEALQAPQEGPARHEGTPTKVSGRGRTTEWGVAIAEEAAPGDIVQVSTRKGRQWYTVITEKVRTRTNADGSEVGVYRTAKERYETFEAASVATLPRTEEAAPDESPRDTGREPGGEGAEAGPRAPAEGRDAGVPGSERPAGEGDRGVGAQEPGRQPGEPGDREGGGPVADAGAPAGERPGDPGRVRADEEGRLPAVEPERLAGVGENYTIAPGALAEERSPKAKALDNLAAIRLVKALEREPRAATFEEQSVLAQYVGWGGIKGAFPDEKGDFAKGYEKVGAELRELLTDEEYRTAERSIQYAHYTSEAVINAMWRIAHRVGFRAGTVIEPGMGIGHFAGLMPAWASEMATTYYGVEMDGISAAIAKYLYPRYGVQHADFTKIPLPKDSFDLAIGNPPFADVVVRGDKEYSAKRFLLHDYFFAKTMDALRPGGIMIFVSSAGTMNKVGTSAREYLAERADLVGAIRLPGTAFEKNAGTSVTTDIIVLRKRDPDAEPAGEPWVETTEVTLPNKEGTPTTGAVSPYFVANPEMVLGEEGFFDPLYQNRYGVRGRKGQDLEADLAKAVERLPEQEETMRVAPVVRPQIRSDLFSRENKEGSFYVKDGQLYRLERGTGVLVRQRAKGVRGGVAKRDFEIIQGLIPIRDALRDVMRANLQRDEEAGNKARERLNAHYDRFRERFGAINHERVTERRPTAIMAEGARARAREEARLRGEGWREGTFNAAPYYNTRTIPQIARLRTQARAEAQALGVEFDEGSFDPEEMPNTVTKKYPNLDPLKGDPEMYRLAAMERVNPVTDTVEKGEVFRSNILEEAKAKPVRNAEDAMLHVMNATGRFDLEETARVWGRTPEQTVADLGERVYRVPGMEAWQSSDEYLSGDVKTKLELARKEVERNPALERNVRALEAVIPEDLVPSQIEVNLGAPWLPHEMHLDFAKRLGLKKIKLSYLKHNGQWMLEAGSVARDMAVEWGTSRANVTTILRAAMNRAPSPKIYDPDGEGGSVLNRQDTDEVATKYEAIIEEFERWIRETPAREDEMAAHYNEKLRRYTDREYDGTHLTMPGLVKGWRWRPYQLRVIARILASGNTYMAHAVGSGKTSAMIGAAMELRRLGLAKKPLFVVPNAMLRQFTTEWLQQYPSANLSVADEESFHTDRRKRFIANVALDDSLDAVIMTHSSFGMIPISIAFEEALITEQVDAYRAVLEEMTAEGAAFAVRSRVQKAMERLEQRLRDKGAIEQDQVFTFEEMGVDQLFVDEAHEFRKLEIATSMGTIKGIDPSGANKSRDLWNKVRYLQGIRPGRGVVFASGTPVVNTMGELYSVSRYLQPAALDARGVASFDAWANTFGRPKQVFEPKPDGTHHYVTRFAKFINLPELRRIVAEVADVVRQPELDAHVLRPALRGGKREMVLADYTDAQVAFQQTLTERMERIKARTGPPQKGDDNILVVAGDGRKAAIDMRLVYPDSPNDPRSKLNLLIGDVYETWEQSKNQPFHGEVAGERRYTDEPVARGPATQIVFMGLGLKPIKGFSSAGWFVSELTRRGVPRNEIADIRDFKTNIAKKRLYNDMNEGNVRILFGSPEKLGTGVNVQKRLLAASNLDALWFPSLDEQRVGRILRQGNMNPEIIVRDYATEGTYDSKMWKLMAIKGQFIESFWDGDDSVRSIEDVGMASYFEQASAMSSGDPRLEVLAGLKVEIKRLENQKVAFERSRREGLYQLNITRERIDYLERRVIPNLEEALDKRQDITGDAFEMKIQPDLAKTGITVTDRARAAELLENLHQIAESARAHENVMSDDRVGEVSGFPINIGTGYAISNLSIDFGSYVHPISREYETGKAILGSIQAALANMDSHLKREQRKLQEERESLAALELKAQDADKPWPKQEELVSKRTEVREMEHTMAQEGLERERAAAEARAREEAVAQGERQRRPRTGRRVRLDADQLQAVRTRLEQAARVQFGEQVQVRGTEARPSMVGDVINIVLDSTDAMTSLGHEGVHWLRKVQAFTEQEWSMLEDRARKRWMREFDIARLYPDLTEAQQLEEAIAEGYGRWLGKRSTADTPGRVARILGALRRFLRNVKRWLRNQQWFNYEDIFELVESGEVAAAAGGQSAQSLAQLRRAVKGPEATSAVQDLQETGGYFKRMFGRYHRHLPKTEQFADFHEDLRIRRAALDMAAKKVNDYFREVAGGLTPKQYALLRQKVMLDDLLWTQAEGMAVPFEYEPGDLKSLAAHTERQLKTPAGQAVLERMKIRDAYKAKVRDKLIERGVLRKEDARNPHYFRHQVLMYATQKAAGAGGPMSKTRWMRRRGGESLINADFMVPEAEWLLMAEHKIATNDLVMNKVKDSKYDVSQRVMRLRRAHNKSRTNRALALAEDKAGGEMPSNAAAWEGYQPKSAELQAWRALNQRMAMGFRMFERGLEQVDRDSIPAHLQGEYDAIVSGLDAVIDTKVDRYFGLVGWILSQSDSPAGAGAGALMSTIQRRMAFQQELLGDKFIPQGLGLARNALIAAGETWLEGYRLWQPSKGYMLHVSHTVPDAVMMHFERMAGALEKDAETRLADVVSPGAVQSVLEQLHELRERSGPVAKPYIVIPNEIADTLDESTSLPEDDKFIANLAIRTTSAWKAWTLLNPLTVVRYHSLNLSGDIDIVIGSIPGVMTKKQWYQRIGEAMKILIQVDWKDAKIESNAAYQRALEAGIVSSGWTQAELPEGTRETFERDVNALGSGPIALTKKFWRGTKKASNIRENVLRLALFMELESRGQEALAQGLDPLVDIGYGAARREMVEGITGKTPEEAMRRKIALITRETIGDYQRLSPAGSWLRRGVIPFVAFQEINLRRYTNLFRNIWYRGGQAELDRIAALKRTGFVTGLIAKQSAMVGAALTVRVFAFLGALAAMDALMRTLMGCPHTNDGSSLVKDGLTVGCAKGQNIQIRTQGALSDLFTWMGFPDVQTVMAAAYQGQTGWDEAAWHVADAAASKIANSFNPFLKAVVELPTGLSYWPSITSPKPLRSRTRHALRMGKAEWLYDVATGRPQPQPAYMRYGVGAVFDVRHLNEMAYYETRSLAYMWAEEVLGTEGVSTLRYGESSNLVYYYKLALRAKDKPAQERLRNLILEHVREKRRQGVNTSFKKIMRTAIANQHPLKAIRRSHRARFVSELPPEQRERYERAMEFYREVFGSIRTSTSTTP